MNTHLIHGYTLGNILARMLGCLFIASSLLKVFAFRIFADEVRLYLEAYFPEIFLGHEQILAICVCAVELIMGISAVLCLLKKELCVVYIVILSFFVWLTGINLFFPSLMGSIESCGCFGELIHFTPASSFIKSILLLMMSIIWAYIEHFRNTEKRI